MGKSKELFMEQRENELLDDEKEQIPILNIDDIEIEEDIKENGNKT